MEVRVTMATSVITMQKDDAEDEQERGKQKQRASVDHDNKLLRWHCLVSPDTVARILRRGFQ